MVETMQFRNFIFRHNPEKISVTQSSEIATHFCPGKGDILQQLGPKARKVTCKGSFFGDSFSQAMNQLQEFRAITKDNSSGMLLIPGTAPFIAFLHRLDFDAVGTGKIIPYTMVFIEAKVGNI